MKKYFNEEQAWLKLSPVQRLKESTKLWKLYLSLGGDLGPEPDPQSPFYFPEIRGKKSSNRRAGVHHLRRRRV